MRENRGQKHAYLAGKRAKIKQFSAHWIFLFESTIDYSHILAKLVDKIFPNNQHE